VGQLPTFIHHSRLITLEPKVFEKIQPENLVSLSYRIASGTGMKFHNFDNEMKLFLLPLLLLHQHSSALPSDNAKSNNNNIINPQHGRRRRSEQRVWWKLLDASYQQTGRRSKYNKVG